MAAKAKKPTKRTPAQWVIVRAYYSGVHFGRVVRGSGTTSITLADARRIWAWDGANTLSAIANHGCGVGSKISNVVHEIVVHEICEEMVCAPAAITALRGAPVW